MPLVYERSLNMKKKIFLKLYTTGDATYRAIIKTVHSRLIYIELTIHKHVCSISDCFYIDRVRGGEYYAVPHKLITKKFSPDKLLCVISNELDRKYFGIEIVDSYSNLSKNEFIDHKLSEDKQGYKFLIFVGNGHTVNGIPEILQTRFKNMIHRVIYLELHYQSHGLGVVKECYYYDREYKSRNKVMPGSLSSVFFEYSRNGILKLVNNELNTLFTDIIFVTDNSIDINSPLPLCGNV